MFNKKNIVGAASVVATALIAANAYATVPGVYVGGQVGWGDVHQKGITQGDMSAPAPGVTYNAFSNSSKDDGLAGRLFAGYQFNPFVAAELGYTKFSNTTTHASGTGNVLGVPFSASASGTIHSDAVDLVAKGILPLQAGFSVYGKLGAAYLMEHASASITSNVSTFPTVAGSSSHRLYPTFGLGVAYDVTPNAAIDVAWNRIQKVGHDNNLASTDFLGAGLIYSFG